MASVSEVKAKLSAYLDAVKAGEEVIITERGTPIARLLPIRAMMADAHLQRLAAAGVVRLAESPVPAELLETAPVSDPGGGVLAALLEDREEGR